MISLVNRQSLLGPFVALFAFPVSFWGSDVCGDARQQFQARSFRAAQSLLWACWEQQGSRPDPSIAYELAQTYRQLKNYRSGLDRLEATPDGRNLADRRYLQGYLRFRMGMFQESITALHEAFLYDPADWRVHQVFALNFVMLERRDAALHEFRTAIGLQPRNAELHYQLSRYLYVLNRFEEAIKEAQAALEIAPAYIDARTDLALCYEALGRDAAAEQEHRKAVDLASRASEKDEWPYINYGAWLARKGRYRESLPVLREATTIAPHSYEAWLLGGKANAALGRYAEARADLVRAISADEDQPGAYYQLATVARKTGDFAASRRYLELFAAKSERKSTAAHIKKSTDTKRPDDVIR